MRIAHLSNKNIGKLKLKIPLKVKECKRDKLNK